MKESVDQLPTTTPMPFGQDGYPPSNLLHNNDCNCRSNQRRSQVCDFRNPERVHGYYQWTTRLCEDHWELPTRSWWNLRMSFCSYRACWVHQEWWNQDNERISLLSKRDQHWSLCYIPHNQSTTTMDKTWICLVLLATFVVASCVLIAMAKMDKRKSTRESFKF